MVIRMAKQCSLLVSDKIKAGMRKHFSGIILWPLIFWFFPHGYMKEKNRSRSIKMPQMPPRILNEQGEQMQLAYIADENVKYGITAGHTPHYIFWNHADPSLPVHFYGYLGIEEAKRDKCAQLKCLYIIESRQIIPRVYEYIEKHSGDLNLIFDYIFTPDSKLLEMFKNAFFMPASGLWYGTNRWGGVLDKNRWQKKERSCAILASHKCRCELHQFRREVAMHFENDGRVDTYGTFNGGRIAELNETLDTYRYCIVIENDIIPYYFTEKILNCFAAMTVPIYIGATSISNFFNSDGIIQLFGNPDIEAVEQALAQCSEEDYEKRKDAIIDNFNRVQNYLCPEDYLYRNYGKKLFL